MCVCLLIVKLYEFNIKGKVLLLCLNKKMSFHTKKKRRAVWLCSYVAMAFCCGFCYRGGMRTEMLIKQSGLALLLFFLVDC